MSNKATSKLILVYASAVIFILFHQLGVRDESIGVGDESNALYNGDIEQQRGIAVTGDEAKLYNGDRGCTSRKHKLIYSHVPKTGGTTIERSILFNDAELYHPVGGHYTLDDMLYNRKERGIDDFTVAAHIRHPCERYASAFYYLKNGGGNPVDRAWAEENIGDMTIREFTLHQKETGWKALRTWAHFFPMTNYLMQTVSDEHGTRIEFGVDEVLCQEQWDEGVHRLFNAVGIEVPDHLLHATKKSTDGNYHSHALRNKHETCKHLDGETRALIAKYYAMDYCMLGYSLHPEKMDSSTCIGTGKDRAYFTGRYEVCEPLLRKREQLFIVRALP